MKKGYSGGTAARREKSASQVYDRANGFLLGCFLSLVRFKFVGRDYPLHRARIHEFFAEAGIDIRLPPTRRAYGRVADAVQLRVAKACNKRSPVLRDFMLIGAMATMDALLRLSNRNPPEAFREQSIRALKRHRLAGKSLYDRYLARVAQQAQEAAAGPDRVRLEVVLTPAMEMLTRAIEPLKGPADLCFVAMPFKPPYAGYFHSFYRPIADVLECRAFRMWGDLSGEGYVDLMLAIIRRCKYVIADLSTANTNVLYEFGVARGLEKRVLPLCQRAGMKSLPSNITSDQMFQVYSAREKDWPDGVARRCATQVFFVDFANELAEDAVSKARWVRGKPLPQLPADTP